MASTQVSAGAAVTAAKANEITIGTTAPTSPATGWIWIDTSGAIPAAKAWDGAAWQTVSSQAFQIGTTAPTSPAAGWLWVDTSGSTEVIKIYNGTSWIVRVPEPVADAVMRVPVGGTAPAYQKLAYMARKTAATSRASTVTVTDDPVLSIAVPSSASNEWWHVRLVLLVTQATTANGGFRFKLNCPTFSAYTLAYGVTMQAGGGSGNIGSATTASELTVLFGTETAAMITIDLVCLINAAGSFTLQWAQAVSDADNTTLEPGSMMIVTRIGA